MFGATIHMCDDWSVVADAVSVERNVNMGARVALHVGGNVEVIVGASCMHCLLAIRLHRLSPRSSHRLFPGPLQKSLPWVCGCAKSMLLGLLWSCCGARERF